VLKLAGSNPEPAPAPTETPIDDAPPADAGLDNQPSSDDKPFDDEPFDAGVEADEQSDPKKYIEQLTGKLGQSLRKYNEEQGQPDFELEKFAINSLLSATHTSEMDAKDQDDIIKKVKEAGENDDNLQDTEVDANNDTPDSADLGVDGDTGSSEPSMDASSGEVNEEMTNLFVNPKKNNMFQPGSNDVLKGDNLEKKDGEDLKESEKIRIFGKIKTRLRETFNQEDEKMTEPMVEPQVKPAPTTKPAPDKVQPNIAPSRKNKPFLPMPEVKPDPKASK